MIDDTKFKKIQLEELHGLVVELLRNVSFKNEESNNKVKELLGEEAKEDINLFKELKTYLKEVSEQIYIHRYDQPNVIYDIIIDNYLKKVKGIASIVPGLTTSISDDKTGFSLETYSGVTSDNGEEIDENTRFDFASMTKLFTAALVLKLKEEGLFDDTKSVKELSNGFFEKLEIPASQLEKFCTCIRTEKRIDGDISKEIFDSLLKNAYKVDNLEYEYNDILYIILKMILPEDEDYFKMYFHDELRLLDTSYKKFGKMTGGSSSAIDLPYDPKAKNMIKFGYTEPGHAGLFGTTRDLVKLHKQLKGFLNKESLKYLVTKGLDKDRIIDDKGKPVNVNKAMGVFVNVTGGLKRGEVVPYLSKNAFSSVGSSGSYSTFDLDNGLTANFLSNPYSGDKPIDVDTSDPKYNFGDVIDKDTKLRVMKKRIELYDKNGDPIREYDADDKIKLDKDGNEIIKTIPFVRLTNELKTEQIKTLLGLRLANRILYRVVNELVNEESEIARRKLDDSNLGNNTSVVKHL